MGDEEAFKDLGAWGTLKTKIFVQRFPTGIIPCNLGLRQVKPQHNRDLEEMVQCDQEAQNPKIFFPNKNSIFQTPHPPRSLAIQSQSAQRSKKFLKIKSSSNDNQVKKQENQILMDKFNEQKSMLEYYFKQSTSTRNSRFVKQLYSRKI